MTNEQARNMGFQTGLAGVPRTLLILPYFMDGETEALITEVSLHFPPRAGDPSPRAEESCSPSQGLIPT